VSFLDELRKGGNHTLTENSALTNVSTLDPVLDFFSLAGAMRNNVSAATQLFAKAFDADPLYAIRTLFYLRDIRGGQGERDLFRALYLELYNHDAKLADELLELIPFYGRWDDVLAVSPTYSAAKLIGKQFISDWTAKRDGKPVSLMAKWLPSENASSSKSRELARSLANALGMSYKEYRQQVVGLRKYIQLLEQDMSSGNWSEIDYSRVPSQAQRKHGKAFRRHDNGRYSDFLDSALRGDTKINTGTLFTYEVFDALRQGDKQAANTIWANLPDYTNGKNALVVADVSGSMYGRPMDVSVSLALYFAEHNTGAFHNYFMTFSSMPQLVHVSGHDLAEKLDNISRANWGMNTDIEAVFRTVLQAAIKSSASPEELPSTIYIISDMEFDASSRNSSATNFENAQKMFNEAGYALPHLVFWNVDARNIQTPATMFDNRVTLISGLSQSAFRYAVEGKSPLELMYSVLDSDRYARIVLPSRYDATKYTNQLVQNVRSYDDTPRSTVPESMTPYDGYWHLANSFRR